MAPRFTLPDELPAGVRALLERIGESLDAGATRIVLDIDPVVSLGDRVVAALISVLRAGRERGVETTLVVGRPELRAELALFGLDLIFTIVEPGVERPEGVEIRTAVKRRKRRPAVAGAALVLALVAPGLASAGASSDMTPEQVVENVVGSDAAIDSYKARVDVALRLHSFPFISERLAGTTYFKRPDNFEVVFDKVPSYARGFETVYTDIDDPSGWGRRFAMSYAGERTVGGHTDTIIRLVQRVRGMIDHEDVAIDPATWHVDGMEWHYYNGGSISMTQTYERIAGFDVLSRQHATIAIPFVSAVADASYHDYRTNVPIDDSVFARGRK